MNTLKLKKGLTLIEAVFATLLLGLTIALVLGTFVLGRVSANKAKHRIEALNLVSAKIEDLKNASYDAIGDESAVSVLLDNGATPLDTSDDLIGSRTVSIQSFGDYKQIDVTITWSEPSWGSFTSAQESLITLIGD